MTSSLARRGALAGGALLATLVGVVGFAHSRAGRPLLVAMGHAFAGKASCPLGYDSAAGPAAHEAARARFAASHRGAVPAATRPALGFALDETLRSAVVGEMAAHGVSCKPGRAGDLVCEHVPADLSVDGTATSVDRELWLTFGARDQLLSIVALSRSAVPGAISAAFSAVTNLVTGAAGQPSSITGDSAAEALASGSLRQASAEFRFTNYYALARATNLGNGFLLTEEYRSLTD